MLNPLGQSMGVIHEHLTAEAVGEGLGSQNGFVRSQPLARERVETREPRAPACDGLLELRKQNATAPQP